jgi:hypothetical protein
MNNKDAATTISRRAVLTGTAALVPLVSISSCTSTQTSPQSVAATSPFTAEEQAVLRAVVDRLIPADEFSPAASDCGVLTYLDRCLSEWNQSDVPVLRQTLQVLEAQAQLRGGAFMALDASMQDSLLQAMEAGEFADAAGQAGFNRLWRLTLEGMFSDPYYGGNRDYAGWELLGYPGAMLATTPEMQTMGQRLPNLRTSAYGAEHDGH